MTTHHATRRAQERHSITPDAEDWRGAVLDICATVAGEPRALLLRRVAAHREEWLVHVRGRDVRVIYAPETACIVTVLPAGRR